MLPKPFIGTKEFKYITLQFTSDWTSVLLCFYGPVHFSIFCLPDWWMQTNIYKEMGDWLFQVAYTTMHSKTRYFCKTLIETRFHTRFRNTAVNHSSVIDLHVLQKFPKHAAGCQQSCLVRRIFFGHMEALAGTIYIEVTTYSWLAAWTEFGLQSPSDVAPNICDDIIRPV